MIKPKEYADEFGVDALRYFVLREAPFGQDADFSRMSFIYRVNADLANDLGNLLSRTTAMINKFAGGVIPAAGEWTDLDRAIPELAGETIERAAGAFDRLDFQEGMAQVFRLVGAANKYVDEAAPWLLARTDEGRRRLGTVLYNLAESLRIATVALSPVLTRKAAEIWTQLGLDGEPSDAGWDATRWGGLAPGIRVRRGEPVFPRFDTKAEVDIGYQQANRRIGPRMSLRLLSRSEGSEDLPGWICEWLHLGGREGIRIRQTCQDPGRPGAGAPADRVRIARHHSPEERGKRSCCGCQSEACHAARRSLQWHAAGCVDRRRHEGAFRAHAGSADCAREQGEVAIDYRLPCAPR